MHRWSICVGLVLLWTSWAAAAPIAVATTDNLQGVIDANPAGTVFALATGTHRKSFIQPKDGDTLQGTTGTILSGGVVLTGWTASGSDFFVTGQTQQGSVVNAGNCEAAFPLCAVPEDVFYDDVPLAPVASQAALAPGKFFFDYAADRIYIRDNPTGHTVETSVQATALYGAAKNVTIRGIKIEKYATSTQTGAIGYNGQSLGTGWVIENCEIRHSHARGVIMKSGWTLRGNNIHDNGHLGVAGDGIGLTLLGNTISTNNYAHMAPGFEGGATKLVFAHGPRFIRNTVQNNYGPGLWCDINCVDVLYDRNVVSGNADAGIFHEISYRATIRHNVSTDNGLLLHGWAFGAQIQVASSERTEVFGNVLHISASGGAGVTVSQQSRGSGTFGTYTARNNRVHHNTVRYASGTSFLDGYSGLFDDTGTGSASVSNNTFEENVYFVDAAAPVFQRAGCEFSTSTFAAIQACGQELRGARY